MPKEDIASREEARHCRDIKPRCIGAPHDTQVSMAAHAGRNASANAAPRIRSFCRTGRIADGTERRREPTGGAWTERLGW
jgi:hypothetical protein